MRVAYFGSPPDAVPALQALVAHGHQVVLVVTQPDRRRGRGGQTTPSPVKAAALDLGLSVRTPVKSGEVLDDLVAAAPDVGVVVAFGQLIPPRVLAVPPLGLVNVHFSLLPRWRGAAPVERAILAGDPTTGVCIMALEAGLDTGPVFARRELDIGADETAGELRARLVEVGTSLLLEVLDRVATDTPVPQAGEPTYASKLTVEEFALDWTRPAAELARVVRAGNPRPGAWTTLGAKRLKVWRAAALDADQVMPEPGLVTTDGVVATGHGGLRLLEVQPEGRPAMEARAWLAGRPGRDGALRLGT